MDTIALKILKPLNPIRHFRSRSSVSLYNSLCFPRINNIRHPYLFSAPFCSLNTEEVNRASLPNRVGEAVNKEVFQNKILQVVLVSPQIPGNAGSIARTCAASAVGLHLVGPLGFKVDDAKLKRAGLDYWPFGLSNSYGKFHLYRFQRYVVVKVHSSWAEFQDYFCEQDGEKRLLAFTKRGTNIHSDVTYRRGDFLIFGSETSGLPPEVLQDCKSEAFGGGTIKIPMVGTYVRSLNLSVSVGIALYEASRQLNYEQLKFSSKSCIEYDSEQLFSHEDTYA